MDRLGAVLLFPIGLFGLLITDTATITLTFRAEEGGSARVEISGTGPKRVQDAFASMDLDD